jgi:hypothetical protein
VFVCFTDFIVFVAWAIAMTAVVPMRIRTQAIIIITTTMDFASRVAREEGKAIFHLLHLLP